MTWLAWRQFRISALMAGVGLAAFAVLLALTTHGSSALPCAGGACPVSDGQVWRLSHDHLLQFLSTLLVGLPAIVGVFWGAPLVARELESGTFRLAWTQTVTRTRWLATKLAVVGLAAAVSCGLLSLMLGWWSSAAVNRGRLGPAMFAERGIVPVGYAVFAVALAVAAGALVRRTLPAMGLALFGFVGTRMVIQFFVRAHLLPARQLSLSLSGSDGIAVSRDSHGVLSLIPFHLELPGKWVFAEHIVDAAGHAPASGYVTSMCRGLIQPPPSNAVTSGPAPAPLKAVQGFQRCLSTVGQRYHEVATYQPASHYWGLQLLETAIFLALAGVLVGITFWTVRRRIT
jgi:hypothetical protein